MKPSLLILAAGIGSRYGGLKQLDHIGPSGETIIDYSIYDALRAGFEKVIFIIKQSIEADFRKAFVDRLSDLVEIDYVFQEIWMVPEGILISDSRQKPWGTGHAVLMADGRIDVPFAVINADDFYGQDAYQALAGYYKDWTPGRENDYCMVGYEVQNTLSEFGAVSRGVCQRDENGFLVDVVERTRIEKNGKEIRYTDDRGLATSLAPDTVVSMNFWGFTPSFFNHLRDGFTDFIRKNADNPKAEFYIPSMVNDLIKTNRASVKILNCAEQWFGMTYREDREAVVRNLRSLVDKGVYPENLWGT